MASSRAFLAATFWARAAASRSWNGEKVSQCQRGRQKETKDKRLAYSAQNNVAAFRLAYTLFGMSILSSLTINFSLISSCHFFKGRVVTPAGKTLRPN